MRTPAIALMLVAAALAGCAGDEGAVSLESLSLGTIAGTVTDIGLTPLAGATVRIDGQNDTATTDAAGSFTLRVPPGEYLVLASYAGHRGGALRAAPGAGETARLAFTLAALPREAPEIVVAEQHGLISCGATLIAAEQEQAVACGGSDPNQRTLVAFPVQQTAGLSGLVVEVVWEANTQASGWLHVLVTTGEGETQSFIAETTGGEGHIVISVPGRVLEGVLVAGDTLSVEVAPTGSLTDDEAGLDGGVVFQQAFTVYTSLFYHQTQPTGYTVLK